MKNKPSDKRGIALVVVLGMLALLVMIGVSFSVFMRTERQAAGSFQHDVRARLLLQAAAVRAVEAIDTSLASSAYPAWTYLRSGTNGGITLSTGDVWAAHVPTSLLSPMPAEPTWISVPNGRIGYLIFNASGLLDANTVGNDGAGIIKRGVGVDPREIDLTVLSEVRNAVELIDNRLYESVREMKRAGSAIGLSEVKNLVSYSRSPTNVTPVPVDMSGDVAALTARKAEIQTAIGGMSGLSGANLDIVFDALLDYVDTNSIPRNLNSPCTERVPMINEVRCQPYIVKATVGGVSVSRLAFDFKVELFYPFAKANLDSFTLQYKYTIEAVGAASGFPTPGTVIKTSPSKYIEGTYTPVTIDTPPAVNPVLTGFENQTASFKITIEYLNLFDSLGNKVDSVENPIFLSARAEYYPIITVPPVPPAERLRGTVGGAECVDPRFNHVRNCWIPYSKVFNDTGGGAGGSTNALNAYTSYQLAKTTTDGHPWMLVADQPFQSAGEWSYIVRGGSGLADTWRTFRLLDEGSQKADAIYTYFTVNPTNATQRGFVNPNTGATNVLEAVFKGMPLDAYPGEANPHTVTADEAKILASNWMLDPLSSNKSEMVENTHYIAAVSSIIDGLGLSYKEFRKEAGIRNLFGLLNPRQNYFIIALFAQSSARVPVPDNNGVVSWKDSVRSDMTGILELWRDPVGRVDATSGMTNYPMFIRRFDVLNQD